MADAARGLAKSAEAPLATFGKPPTAAPLTPQALRTLPQDSASMQSAHAIQRLQRESLSPKSSPRGKMDSPREGRHVGFSDASCLQPAGQPVVGSGATPAGLAAAMQAPAEQQMQVWSTP